MISEHFPQSLNRNGSIAAPLFNLQSALDMESLWQSCLEIVELAIPYRSCSLMSDITGFRPTQARHHVKAPRSPDYMPATSLTISQPYLAQNPLVRRYTYSQIASQDSHAPERRLAQEPEPEWENFVHLAFWRDGLPEAVLSIHRPPEQSGLADGEIGLLDYIYPMIDAGLQRLRHLEREREKTEALTGFLQRLPLAVMLVASDGRTLYSNDDARRLIERWDRNLRQRDAENHRMATCIGRLLGSTGDRGRVPFVEHPHLKGFRIRAEPQEHGVRTDPSRTFVLTFEESCDLRRDIALPSQAAAAALRRLSASERRVALLVGLGLRNEDIAQRICRSRRTIESQISSIFSKLHLTNRAQLVRMLSQRDNFEPDFWDGHFR